MGGDGSGNHREKKDTVEDCLILSCSWFLQHNYFDLAVGAWREGGITWLNFFGRPTLTLDFRVQRESEGEMLLLLLNMDQYVFLQPTPLRFGGVRWWFLCSECGRRCAKLYVRRLNPLFLCRACQNVGYAHDETKFKGYSVTQLAQGLKKEFWWRYPPWRRKRDRRPNYRDRGAWLRELYGDRVRM